MGRESGERAPLMTRIPSSSALYWRHAVLLKCGPNPQAEFVGAAIVEAFDQRKACERAYACNCSAAAPSLICNRFDAENPPDMSRTGLNIPVDTKTGSRH
jgi:hypothetical protein